MAYDLTKPVDHAPVIASELRDQFAGLQDNIENLYADSSGGCLTVDYLNLTVSNPPTQAEMQAIADKLDEILTHLRRE